MKVVKKSGIEKYYEKKYGKEEVEAIKKRLRDKKNMLWFWRRSRCRS